MTARSSSDPRLPTELPEDNRERSSRSKIGRWQDDVRVQLGFFVVLAFVLSWSWWLPMVLTGVVVHNGDAWPSHLPGLLGPGVAAMVTVAVFQGRQGFIDLWSRIVRWRFSWVMWVILAATLAFIAIPFITTTAVSGSDFLSYSGAPQAGVLTVLYVLIVNGFGEEAGWRGFLADSLMKRHRLGLVALIVWAVWGAWHLPLFWIVGNFRDLGPGGIIGWAVGLLSGSVILTWLYSQSRGSILFVAIWHTIFNFATATTASAGLGAAVASTVVIIFSLIIVCFPSFWHKPGYEKEEHPASTPILN